MLLALAAPVLTSCSDKDSEDKSRITYYAVLELNGDANMTTPVGAPFTDPGCKATMGGEDVSDQIQVTGSVNSNVVGFYPLGYTVVKPLLIPTTSPAPTTARASMAAVTTITLLSVSTTMETVHILSTTSLAVSTATDATPAIWECSTSSWMPLLS